MKETLTPQELYKRAMRLRLTRAGLLKIMRENEAKAEEAYKSSIDFDNADAVP